MVRSLEKECGERMWRKEWEKSVEKEYGYGVGAECEGEVFI